MSTVVEPPSVGSERSDATTVQTIRPPRSEHAGRVRSRALATIDAAMLVLALALIASTNQELGGFGLAIYGLLSFILLIPSERCIPHERGRFVVLTEIVSVPAVLATSAVITLLALWAAGTNIEPHDAVVPWLLSSSYVVAGRAAFASAAASLPIASVTEGVDLLVKRVVDLVVAVVLLVLIFPIAVVLAAAIWLEDRGPVLYRCRRIGQRGREFNMLKFRKMQDDAAGPPLTSADDDRFTRVGRFLARSKLDELPQLWNVIRGEMSLVGPRPEDPEFVALHPTAYETIVRIRPGITGLCQLAFAKESQIIGDNDPVQVYAERFLPQKLGIDLVYVQQRTVILDFKILFWTGVVLLRKDVAVHRQTGRLTLRRQREASAAKAA
jgi:lipopolysaccharide/colanic/teichoic acid biosynthesis glycosyltransferase